MDSWTVPAGVTFHQCTAIGGGRYDIRLGMVAVVLLVLSLCLYFITISKFWCNCSYFYVGNAAANSWVNIAANAAPSNVANGCLARGGKNSSVNGYGVAFTTGGIGTVVYYGANGRDIGE